MKATKTFGGQDQFQTELGFTFIQGDRVTWFNPETSKEAGDLGTVVEVYPNDMRIKWDNGHISHEEANSPVFPA